MKTAFVQIADALFLDLIRDLNPVLSLSPVHSLSPVRSL